jgi:hypothetical protein
MSAPSDVAPTQPDLAEHIQQLFKDIQDFVNWVNFWMSNRDVKHTPTEQEKVITAGVLWFYSCIGCDDYSMVGLIRKCTTVDELLQKCRDQFSEFWSWWICVVLSRCIDPDERSGRRGRYDFQCFATECSALTNEHRHLDYFNDFFWDGPIHTRKSKPNKQELERHYISPLYRNIKPNFIDEFLKQGVVYHAYCFERMQRNFRLNPGKRAGYMDYDKKEQRYYKGDY